MTTELELLRRVETVVRAYRDTVSPDDDLPDPACLLDGVEDAFRALDAYRANPVHFCDQGQQPDIHIECSDAWDTPAFDTNEVKGVVSKGVYRLTGGALYTFDGWRVTCAECLRVRSQKTLEQEHEEVSAFWSNDMVQLALAKAALFSTEQACDRLSYRLDLLRMALHECMQSSIEGRDDVNKDKVAPGVVRVWAHYARAAGTPEAKIQEALAAADRMEQWQKTHGRKVPD